MKGKNLQSRILYPARLLLWFNEEIKSSINKQNQNEFSTTKSALEHIVKVLFLGGKENATARNKKIMKEKAHW